MTYAAVARFNSPQEAHIAAGALNAAGFDARVFDDNHAQMFWLTRTAIGCRLVVPAGELDEARETLRRLEAGVDLVEADIDEPPPPRSKRLIFAIGAFLFGA